MSKRRKSGDIVWKKENAGFVGEASLCQIQPETDEDWSPCMMDCGDKDCREWATLWECNASGKALGGVACHVSECQMKDPP